LVKCEGCRAALPRRPNFQVGTLRRKIPVPVPAGGIERPVAGEIRYGCTAERGAGFRSAKALPQL